MARLAALFMAGSSVIVAVNALMLKRLHLPRAVGASSPTSLAEGHMLDVLVGRVRSAVLAAWGGFIGLLPHVLHHVGPLAGAALLAGTEGTILFATIGLVAAVPFLLRVYRRFRTWRAPVIALAVFAAMFSLSSFVIGPAISGGEDTSPRPGTEDRDHEKHH